MLAGQEWILFNYYSFFPVSNFQFSIPFTVDLPPLASHLFLHLPPLPSSPLHKSARSVFYLFPCCHLLQETIFHFWCIIIFPLPFGTDFDVIANTLSVPKESHKSNKKATKIIFCSFTITCRNLLQNFSMIKAQRRTRETFSVTCSKIAAKTWHFWNAKRNKYLPVFPKKTCFDLLN